MAGYATITMPEIPAPTPPEGWTLNGYKVTYWGPKDQEVFCDTIEEGVKELERGLDDMIRVYAECVRYVGDHDGIEFVERMSARWLSGSEKWTPWRHE